MPKIIYIEPEGCHSYMLFDTFKETFEKDGYVETINKNDADIAFIDLYSFIKGADFSWVADRKIPLVFFDATDYGGMSKERFDCCGYDVLARLHKIIVFVRKMDKTLTYPSYVHPYEHIIEFDFPLVSKEDLCNRQYDVCFIGNTSPQREKVRNELSKHFKCDFVLGQERIPHKEWIRRHMNAKFFIESDGGGFGSERPFKLMSVAPMLMQKNNMLRLNDWEVMHECIHISEEPLAGEMMSLDDALTDREFLYHLYIHGHEKLKEYFNAEYRSKYILSILKENGL